MELDHLIQDTIEALRPDLTPYATFQEAYEAAAELEKKYKNKIGEYLEYSAFVICLKINMCILLLLCTYMYMYRRLGAYGGRGRRRGGGGGG